MKISHEVKISDDNYGNSTHKMELEIAPEHLVAVSSYLDQWEALLRTRGPARDEESLTVREYERLKVEREKFNEILATLAGFIRQSD